MVLHEYKEDFYSTLEDMHLQEVVMLLEGVNNKQIKHKNTAIPYLW